jgi:hypothetical protein
MGMGDFAVRYIYQSITIWFFFFNLFLRTFCLFPGDRGSSLPEVKIKRAGCLTGADAIC